MRLVLVSTVPTAQLYQKNKTTERLGQLVRNNGDLILLSSREGKRVRHISLADLAELAATPNIRERWREIVRHVIALEAQGKHDVRLIFHFPTWGTLNMELIAAETTALIFHACLSWSNVVLLAEPSPQFDVLYKLVTEHFPNPPPLHHHVGNYIASLNTQQAQPA